MPSRHSFTKRFDQFSMEKYWEKCFRNEGLLWREEPADSALIARDIFAQRGLRRVLIPGIGYGRNARIFKQAGFDITGIEVSATAISLARDQLGLDIPIHHGSVTDMPFDDIQFDGIYCHAVVHLLNRSERKKFIRDCFSQLQTGGTMLFTVVSMDATMYGQGRRLSKDRYEISRGLRVYFYNKKTVLTEFGDYGSLEVCEFDEPIKYESSQPSLKCILVQCNKS